MLSLSHSLKLSIFQSENRVHWHYYTWRVRLHTSFITLLFHHFYRLFGREEPPSASGAHIPKLLNLVLCGQIGWYLTHYFRRDRKHLKFLVCAPCATSLCRLLMSSCIGLSPQVLLVLFLSICHFGLYVLTSTFPTLSTVFCC